MGISGATAPVELLPLHTRRPKRKRQTSNLPVPVLIRSEDACGESLPNPYSLPLVGATPESLDVPELDPDEPAVPVTGLAFLCQQFVLLLRQRALDGESAAIGLEEATEKLCARVKSSDDKTVRAFLARLSFFLLYSPHTYIRTRTAADMCATSLCQHRSSAVYTT